VVLPTTTQSCVQAPVQSPGMRSTELLFSLAAPLALSGCVERVIRITSEPSGALVWVNDREVGRTPLEISFIHYGRYDVRIEKEGFEPQMTFGEANAPLWDAVGPDLIAELLPLPLRSEIAWHYPLMPASTDRQALIARANELRAQSEKEAAAAKAAEEEARQRALQESESPEGGADRGSGGQD